MSKDSRDLHDLLPFVRDKAISFIARAEMEIPGLKLVVSQTYRSPESQDELYQIGRRGVTGEKIVTNCKGGDSFHQYRIAFDVFPLRYGKPILFESDGDEVSDPVWQKLGEIAEECGLEWAGRWNHNREGPHFQDSHGLTLAQLKAGNVPT